MNERRRKFGYWVSLTAALASFLAFLFLPYVDYAYYWYGGEDYGGFGYYTWQDPFFCPEVFLYGAAVIVAVWYLFRRSPSLRGSSRRDYSFRRSPLITLVLGILGFIIQRGSLILLVLGILGFILDDLGAGVYINYIPLGIYCHPICGYEGVNIVHYQLGYYLYLVGGIGLVVGAILSLSAE